jgi:hypothetical protein
LELNIKGVLRAAMKRENPVGESKGGKTALTKNAVHSIALLNMNQPKFTAIFNSASSGLVGTKISMQKPSGFPHGPKG